MNSNSKISESFEHLRIKEYLNTNLPQDNPVTRIILEYCIGKRIADIYLKLKDGKEIIIEIQRSKIKVEDIKQRTKEYNDNDLYVIWILDGISFNKYPCYEEGISLTKIEKELHKMYRGRVYYMNTKKDRIITPLFPLHFAPYYECRKITPNFCVYSKSKINSTIIPGTLTSLNITTFRNYGYKLARFLDPNVRNLCYEAIGNFLKNFSNEISHFKNSASFSSNLNIKKTLLYVAVRKFEPIFGLHLLYDILRRKNLLQKKEFHLLKSIYNFRKKMQNQ
ncbi:MAG: competence protein CoiA family protein [Promethearchaeota archaeon]